MNQCIIPVDAPSSEKLNEFKWILNSVQVIKNYTQIKMSEAIEDVVDGHPDRIQKTFEDRTLFVTGGTGFMGRVFIEKTLRCFNLRKIYIMVRTKKGKSLNERLIDIFQSPLFDKLKLLKPNEIQSKIELIHGDISAIDLAMSQSDRDKLAQEVDFVFHCAATIRFDEPLKNAVFLNVRGTKLVLELAKQFTKLKIFCHISTAYCHLNERMLFEKIYPPPADPDIIIKTCQLLSDEKIELLSKNTILKEFPNTYAYTKALSEELVAREFDSLPIVILRPSVVIPIWKEPLPGWSDNINGPIGLFIGAGKGVIRTMYCTGNTYSDYMPVDIVINSMVATTCDYLLYKGERRIYNVTSSNQYPVSFEEIIRIARGVVENKVPLNGVFWYPGGGITTSRTLHYIRYYLFQWLPAVVVDALLFILGYKPVLMHVQRRIWKGYEIFEYYANMQWDFNNDYSLKAVELMNPTERKRYKLDGDGLNYEDFFMNCTLAARRYILKETDDTIPSAKRHMRVMWWADRISTVLIVLGFLYLLWTHLVKPILAIS